MAMDWKRLSQLEWGVIGAGGVAFIALFLPWYGVSIAGFSASVSGWRTSYGWLGGFLLVAAAVWFLLSKGDVALPRDQFGPIFVTTAVAALGLLIVIIRWATMPRGGGGILGRYFNYGPRVGIWMALVVGIVEVACAGVLLATSGEPLPWRTDRRP